MDTPLWLSVTELVFLGVIITIQVWSTWDERHGWPTRCSRCGKKVVDGNVRARIMHGRERRTYHGECYIDAIADGDVDAFLEGRL